MSTQRGPCVRACVRVLERTGQVSAAAGSSPASFRLPSLHGQDIDSTQDMTIPPDSQLDQARTLKSSQGILALNEAGGIFKRRRRRRLDFTLGS